MTFANIIYAMTDLFGWVIIGLAVIALGYVGVGYIAQAQRIVAKSGWPELWRQIRVHVLTRKPRN